MVYTLDRLIKIATDLTSQKDIDILLETILSEAMQITACDGGTVYTREGDFLYFRNMITLSKNIALSSKDGGIKLPPVPLGRKHVCACSALDHKIINIADIYLSEEYDFSGSQKYDSLNGYRTCSMLVLPMEDEHGDLIGVLQLINAQDEEGVVVPFDDDCVTLISALASLAAVSLNTHRLSQEVYDLMHSFVRVLVGAIDTRTAYNANHTKSMVNYAGKFIRWLNEEDRGWKIPEKERDPLLMAIWLHDIGKLVIPRRIMDKPTRLENERATAVFHRLEVAVLMERIRSLERPSEREAAEGKIKSLINARALILKANSVPFLPDEMIKEIEEVADLEILTSEGEVKPLLNEMDLAALTVQKGTLTGEERKQMEMHVVHTANMLAEMKFQGAYEKVPLWAASHHELLDGSGYPDHKNSGELSREIRLITILDIYDALTAEDRPYKPPMTPEKAFGILGNMRDEGKIDGEILDMFIESQAWRKDQALSV
ncbi:MAG: GAF domain-containing protein [Lachnospiraceae bacterium]|nr:GAF domain-containing protein [Lachnospiraceae bacterium]